MAQQFQFDFHPDRAGVRNRALTKRLELWHGSKFGWNKRPDNSKFRGGTRAMWAGPTGIETERYAFDPDVSPDAPGVFEADWTYFYSWQTARQGANSWRINSSNADSFGTEIVSLGWSRFDILVSRITPLWMEKVTLEATETMTEDDYDILFSELMVKQLEDIPKPPVAAWQPPSNLFRYAQMAAQVAENANE